MIRYDFTDLSIFLTLARTGSLTKATETLPFTPSALSLRLRKLEDALGAKLFMREARGLALTPAGDVLVRHAQNVLKAAAQLETAMSGFDTKERRTLRIASNSTGLQNVIAPVAGGFLAGRRVRLVFLELRSHEAAEALSDGRADLAFGVEHIFRHSDLPIEVSPLFTDRHVVIVPKSHPLAQREAVRFADTLAPEMDKLKAEAAKWATQEEDVLTYAMFPQVAPKFFDKRNAKKQGVDGDHVDYTNQSHPV